MKTSKKTSGIWWQIGILAMAVIFGLSGCATKQYIGEQLMPVEDRITQTENRIGQAEGQIDELGDRMAAEGDQISNIQDEIEKVDAKAEQALANFGNLKFERRLVVDMKEGANFEFNSAELSDEAKQTIDVFIGNLRGDLAGGQNAVFLVAGHTDDRGSDDYNYELGKRRADMVCRYLITQKNIDPLRIVTISYGETSPVAGNDTGEGRAMNRRVEIFVYSEAITV